MQVMHLDLAILFHLFWREHISFDGNAESEHGAQRAVLPNPKERILSSRRDQVESGSIHNCNLYAGFILLYPY